MEQLYTFKQIKEKFGWYATAQRVSESITYAKNRGVTLEIAGKKGATLFRIIEDKVSNEEWQIYPNNPRYEVSKNGLVRTINKKLVGALTQQGYMVVTDQTQNPTKYYKVHRMVMETFNPIENSETYVVDHINGKKDDNRLENLRWLTQRQNTQARDENYAKLNINFQKLVEKYGYEKLNQIFEKLL